MTDLLITNCIVDSVPGLDIRIADGLITEIARELTPTSEEVLDADGNIVIPGLCDHHIHLHALAARRASVECGPPSINNSVELAAALNNSKSTRAGVRGVGYFESVAGDLDRDSLDRIHSARPVRIQHRSGALWILNSAAVDMVGLDHADHRGVERDFMGRPTGRVWRADTWLRTRFPGNTPPSLKQVSKHLTSLGITAVTDATPDLDSAGLESIASAMDSGDFPQRVHVLGAPLGVDIGSKRMTVGPYKIVLADSDVPDLAGLARTITQAHNIKRPIAAHCVTRESLLILLAALNEVGSMPGDRIEHGALIPRESIQEIYRLGLTVVTQPGFIAQRGDDYLKYVNPIDIGDLYRHRSLLDHHIPVALSSDAPYGPLDPWVVMAAAQNRTAPTGSILGRREGVSLSQALAGYLGTVERPGGPPRRVKVGAPGDLLLLEDGDDHAVIATIINGRRIF